jgi:hypothetical protein
MADQDTGLVELVNFGVGLSLGGQLAFAGQLLSVLIANGFLSKEQSSELLDDQVSLYAVDRLEFNSEDYSNRLLEKRKAKLEKVLAPDSGDADLGALGRGWPDDIQAACKMGLEVIVSKRRDFGYRNGRTKLDENQNPRSPAVLRLQDGSW